MINYFKIVTKIEQNLGERNRFLEILLFWFITFTVDQTSTVCVSIPTWYSSSSLQHIHQINLSSPHFYFMTSFFPSWILLYIHTVSEEKEWLIMIRLRILPFNTFQMKCLQMIHADRFKVICDGVTFFFFTLLLICGLLFRFDNLMNSNFCLHTVKELN